MPPITLRPASSADYAFMRDVKLDGLKPYVEQLFGWNQAEQERRFQEYFEPSASRVILKDGMPIGYVHVLEEGDAMFLAGIYIVAGHQRQGIGTRVIEDLVREANAIGKCVTLQVLRSNPAKALYERIGFCVTTETDTHFQMRSGRVNGGV